MSEPGCNLPAADFGIRCVDSLSCEGLCLPMDARVLRDNGSGFKVPDHEYIEEANGRLGEIIGTFSFWQSDFGCHVIVEAGKYVAI
jgi:hypothetical protein